MTGKGLLLVVISVLFASFAQALSKEEKCLLTKCIRPLFGVLGSRKGRNFLKCATQCDKNDEPCTSRCFFKFGNGKSGALSQCLVEKGCTELVLSKLECPAVVPRSIEHFDVKTLAQYERLFVARGSNDLYDGLPCQYLTFDLQPSGKVATVWSTVIDGIHRAAQYELGQTDANTISTDYSFFGVPVHEDYFILDATEDFVLFFYCGEGMKGQYQGAVVYSTKPSSYIPPDVEARFKAALERANVSVEHVKRFEDFGKVEYPKGYCENIPDGLY